ncbi:hypothetical protein SAY86_027819 [Trapa natans]|uniref:Uncharacterized protein n=1 Tax=Trapa natans TaxID=22666 RepID=A0AAN7LTQ8_TRANT|nr:hypothetical protein SAY86_027819 [Trapa natans]
MTLGHLPQRLNEEGEEPIESFVGKFQTLSVALDCRKKPGLENRQISEVSSLRQQKTAPPIGDR